MSFGTSPNGYIYFSVTEDAGTYAMWRRSFDGALPVQVLTGHASKPLLTRASDQNSSTGGFTGLEDIMFLDSGVDLNLIREDADASFTLSVIDSSISAIADGDNDVMASKSHAMFSLDIDKVLVTHPSADGTTHVMEVYWTDGSGQVATVIGPTDAQGNPNNFESLIVMPTPTPVEGEARFVVSTRKYGSNQTSIYFINLTMANEFDPSSIYTTAWENKETFKENLNFQVTAMGPSLAGLFLFTYDPTTQDKTLSLIAPQSDPSTLYDFTAAGINPYPQPGINSAGDFIIICEQGEGGAQATMSIAITANIANGFVPFYGGFKKQTVKQI